MKKFLIILQLFFIITTFKLMADYKIGIIDPVKILVNSKKGKETMNRLKNYKSQNPSKKDYIEFKKKEFKMIKSDLIEIISKIAKSEGFNAIIQVDNELVYKDNAFNLTKMEMALAYPKVDMTDRIIKIYDSYASNTQEKSNGFAADKDLNLKLIKSAQKGNIDAIKQLPEKGADVNAKNKVESMIWEEAIKSRNIDAINQYIKNYKNGFFSDEAKIAHYILMKKNDMTLKSNIQIIQKCIRIIYYMEDNTKNLLKENVLAVQKILDEKFFKISGNLDQLLEFEKKYPIALLSPRVRELYEDTLIKEIENGRLKRHQKFRINILNPNAFNYRRDANVRFKGRLTIVKDYSGIFEYFFEFETIQDALRADNKMPQRQRNLYRIARSGTFTQTYRIEYRELAFPIKWKFDHTFYFNETNKDKLFLYILPISIQRNNKQMGTFNQFFVPSIKGSILRYKGEIPLRGGIKIVSEFLNPLSFLIIENGDARYLYGKGKVIFPDGTVKIF